MILKETSTKWGNGYVRRYYLDGRRIAEAKADALLAGDCESLGMTMHAGKVTTEWRVPPSREAGSCP